MASIDGSVVNVALPSIQHSFTASVVAMQWVVNAYLLFLGALVLVGGSLGDKLGRRTIFVTGTSLFMLASVACGMASSAGELIAARAVQGIGAALLVPSSLAIIGAVFDENERGRAIGAWAGVGAITSALGPVLGGWLVDTVSWRAIFFLNLPLAAATIALTLIAVPNSRTEEAPERLDWLGALVGTVGLGALSYGLTISPTYGLASARVFTLLITGALALVAFCFLERSHPHPMVPLGLCKRANFVGANLVTLALYFGLAGTLFFLPFALIRGHGYSATEAGAALLPVPLILGGLSRFTGILTRRFGSRALLSVGALVVSFGFGLLGMPLVRGSYWNEFFPALAALGLGLTITVAPLTTVVMGSVPEQSMGVASGINNAVARISGLFAVSVLGIVFTWSYAAATAAHVQGDGGVHVVQPDALTSSSGLAKDLRRDTAVAQGDAINAAMQMVTLVCAACAVAGSAFAATIIRPTTRGRS